ncbi:ribonuclease M5 [Gottschalkiaceae bacterium SANA]|nr:ribonuclease M5 [Gottschalkiaceae bacterium SANA]
MIQEVIVVEGKDDVSAVKKAVACQIISTSGFGYPEDLFDRIRQAQKRCGVIILTDPDYAGERIRNEIAKQVPGCKHAFIPREAATHKGNIGVENASVAAIRKALETCRTEREGVDRYVQTDMIQLGLCGGKGSKDLRIRVGRLLGLGYGNTLQFMRRLNHFDITDEELKSAIKEATHERETI